MAALFLCSCRRSARSPATRIFAAPTATSIRITTAPTLWRTWAGRAVVTILATAARFIVKGSVLASFKSKFILFPGFNFQFLNPAVSGSCPGLRRSCRKVSPPRHPPRRLRCRCRAMCRQLRPTTVSCKGSGLTLLRIPSRTAKPLAGWLAAKRRIASRRDDDPGGL